MIIVTNRNVHKDKTGLAQFGDGFNSAGPNELRLGEARLNGGKWALEILPDKVGSRWASEHLFLQLQKSMKEKKREALFFVHGYNTTFENACSTAWNLESTYGVEVVLFSWPANGGGSSLVRKAYGLGSYLADKRDAALSLGALDRCLEKLGIYLQKHQKTACGRSFNLLCHSMGNYLLKKLMESSIYNGETLLFDNVVLAAADCNNEGHASWVDKIAHRKRIYIAINENDFALNASRLKFGEQQLARLGHYTRNLESKVATYLDFTKANRVGNDHSYFIGDPVANPAVRKAFHAIFNGQKCEEFFNYNPLEKTYEIL